MFSSFAKPLEIIKNYLVFECQLNNLLTHNDLEPKNITQILFFGVFPNSGGVETTRAGQNEQYFILALQIMFIFTIGNYLRKKHYLILCSEHTKQE